MRPQRLTLQGQRFAVARLAPGDAVPPWADGRGFTAVTRTAEELSIVCDEARVPDGVRAERGFRALKLEGPFDFGEVGILVSVAAPLAAAGISLFAISTYDTDYVLVKAGRLDDALDVLSAAGHVIQR